MTWLPPQASTYADSVDRLISVYVGVFSLIVFLISACIIFLSLKYRRSKRPSPPESMKTHVFMEIIWISVPTLVFLVFYIWGGRLFLIEFSNARPDSYQVFVLGKQWMWQFEHPNGRREINEVHLPLNRPVQFIMISQDVIHSAFVPAFRLKHDVLPGRYTMLNFTPSFKGNFDLFCAQYCGTEHSLMRAHVLVLDSSDFDNWVSGARSQITLEQKGKELLTKFQCSSCHRSELATAPPLEGLFGRAVHLANGVSLKADENYIRESIIDPHKKVVRNFQDIMPSFQGKISEEEMIYIIAYIKSSETKL